MNEQEFRAAFVSGELDGLLSASTPDESVVTSSTHITEGAFGGGFYRFGSTVWSTTFGAGPGNGIGVRTFSSPEVASHCLNMVSAMAGQAILSHDGLFTTPIVTRTGQPTGDPNSSDMPDLDQLLAAMFADGDNGGGAYSV